MQVFDPPDGVNREILIGYAINTTTMYPNSNYFRFHAKEWNTLHPDALYMTCPNTLKVGLYSLVLGAAQCEGIYEDIAKVRGVRDANMIMDYIMFLISEKKNATYLMSGALSDQVTFTGLPYSDSAYSKMFSNPMNENYSRAILDLWLQRCIANGMESVYLVIDGSNDDCDAIENELAEPGDAKSHRSGPVMGFMWAVQANGENAGLPVSYFLNKGGIIDARAVNQVCEYFKAFNVKVEGAICDRGFCDLESLKLFLNAKLPYVVMLKKNIKGFKNMVNEHGAGIRTYSNYTKAHMYGVTGETELFKDSGFSSRVALFFDPIKEAFTEIGLMDKIIEAEENIKENIRKGLRASVPRGLRKYMHIEGKGKERVVVIKEELISGDMKMAGFLGIATFKEMTPEQAIIVYNFRMIVEQAFSYFKSQLGCDVMRVFDETSARSKFFVCFMASIIRFRIQQACAGLKLMTNVMISEIGDFQFQLFNREYRFVDITKKDQINLMNSLGITVDMLKDFAPEITCRYIHQDEKTRETDCFNVLPWKRTNKRSTVQSTTSASILSDTNNSPGENPTNATQKVKHPGGRPKGSRNKKTLAREAEEKAKREAEGYVEPVKSKGGRPKGRKDSYQRTRSTKKQMEEKRKAMEL